MSASGGIGARPFLTVGMPAGDDELASLTYMRMQAMPGLQPAMKRSSPSTKSNPSGPDSQTNSPLPPSAVGIVNPQLCIDDDVIAQHDDLAVTVLQYTWHRDRRPA